MKALESLGYVNIKDYTAYTRFHIFKGKYYRIKTFMLPLIIAAICVYLLLYGFSSGEKTYFIIAGIIVLCSLMTVYVLNVSVKNTCKRNADTVRAKQQTVFGKNGFVVDLFFQKEEANEHYEIFYDEVERVYFAPKAIYVYVEKRSAIVIPKRNLKINPYEAREFLKKYIPAQKLVICV